MGNLDKCRAGNTFAQRYAMCFDCKQPDVIAMTCHCLMFDGGLLIWAQSHEQFSAHISNSLRSSGNVYL